MNRLTVTGAEFLTPMQATKEELIAEIKRHQKYYDRLAAYEDTGLEPEEVYKTIKAGVPEWIPKYLEYRNLEEQGLLIKLPCKVGDTVYFIRNKKMQIFEIDTIKVRKQISIHGYYYSTGRRWGTPHEITIGKNTIGKKLFLTREEAERALLEEK